MEDNTIGIATRGPNGFKCVYEEHDIHIQVHKNTLKSELDDFLRVYCNAHYFWSWLFNFIVLLLTLTTTRCMDTLGLSAQTWQAFFYLFTGGVFVSAACCGIKAWKSRGKNSAYFVESLQNIIIKSNNTHLSPSNNHSITFYVPTNASSNQIK